MILIPIGALAIVLGVSALILAALFSVLMLEGPIG